MTDQAKLRLARVEALLDYYPLHQSADMGEDGERLAVTRYVLVQAHGSGDCWHVGADDVEELLRYQENDGEWSPVGIWDLDSGLSTALEVTCDFEGWNDSLDPSLIDATAEPDEETETWAIGKTGAWGPVEFNTRVEAEAAIAGIDLLDPEGVARGDYYIDGPVEEDRA